MKNYDLKTYVKKKLSYTALQTIKAKPHYNGHTMNEREMSFKDVKAVMRELGDISTWDKIKDIFETCFGITEDEFWGGKVMEFFEARNYIIQTFNRLIKVEQKLLSSIESKDSILWQQAGGKRLNKYGGILSLNQLGKLYGSYPFDLENKKYEEILLLLTLEKEQGEIQEKYNKLKNPKR